MLCAALCAVTVISYTVPAFAADPPWYKRFMARRSAKNTETAIPDPSKVLKPGPVGSNDASAQVTASKPAESAPISSYKEDSSALEVDDSLEAFAPAEGEDEEGEIDPDLSKERTPADELLKREFPMPQDAPPAAPPLPPSPQRYQAPTTAPKPAPEIPRAPEARSQQ